MSAVVERAAAQAVGAVAARLVAELGARLPEVTVTREGDAVVIAGAGLAARAVDAPVLRWPAGVLK